MNAKHVELLRRLEQFQIDSPEAALPFAARLARENNWTPSYAQRVIGEYKRFAFLAVAAGHPVSPSEDVDQFWHLHLTYSENYWKIFCPEILGRPLHHQPTQGGQAEGDKFEAWYRRTLESYQTFFGEAPPREIWPTPEERRKEKHNFRRVDRERYWVIPKARLRVDPRFALWPGLMALMVACTGAMLSQRANVFDWRGPDFLTFYIVLLAVCFGVALWVRRKLRVPATGRAFDASALEGYGAAFLNGGNVLAVNTAIANLTRLKAIHVDAKGKRISSLPLQPEFGHELERVIYTAAKSSPGSIIADVRLAAKPIVTQLAEKLTTQGLVMATAPARKASLIPLMLVLGGVAVGVAKIFVGLGRDKPVGILAVLCLTSVVMAFVAFARRPLRSQYGDAVLKQLKEGHRGPRRLGRNNPGLSAAEFATMVGLFGMTALAGSEFNDLRKSLQPPSGGSSCGSGCGSSGCGGGGGGGCGGCGGGD